MRISLVPLALLAGLGLLLCQALIFFYAPTEATMGMMQKIFYTHLPLAWWSFASFMMTCIASIAYARTRNTDWDTLAGAAAELGMVCCSLALLTGAIWSRHSWGVWWTWDPRLTTTLIMWFVYAGYLVLRTLEMPRQRRGMMCAVVGIVAFLDVPLVFLSARLWRSIHPAVFASRGGGLDPDMRTTVMLCVLIFGIFWGVLLALRTKQVRFADKLDAMALHFMEKDEN